MYDKDYINNLSEQYKKWYEKVVKKAISRFPERKEKFYSPSNIEIKRLYTPEDIKDLDYEKDLGFPGQSPYTRGVQPTMYRGRLWTMRQYAGFGSARETNERFLYLLKAGQTGLSVAFDLPTQLGYDSDDEMSKGEVGKVGVAIDSIEDMDVLFKDIPLDKVSTSMTINSTAAIILAMYVILAEERGISADKLSGTIQNDLLKEFIARGTYIYPPVPSIKLAMDVIRYAREHIPKFNPISISGYHIREAGANAIQEVAFTMADAIAYLKAAKEYNIDLTSFAKRISFFFASHNDLLEEVAKFRAARRMWAKILKERFNITDEKALRMRFHTQTGGSTLIAKQVDTNVVRVTIQALAAVLGGTQSLHTNSRDEALALPTRESATLALRTQQIIAYESGVVDTIDPLAGSYYVESLTSTIEKKAFEYIDKIEAIGGALKAIEMGYIQKEISTSAYQYQKEIESGKRIIVGLNKFTDNSEEKKELLRVNPEIEIEQRERLKRLRQERDNIKVNEVLQELKNRAQEDKDLMPSILQAVKVRATIGEISNALREVFGEFEHSKQF